LLLAGRAQIPPKPLPILLIRFRRGNGTERVRFPGVSVWRLRSTGKEKEEEFLSSGPERNFLRDPTKDSDLSKSEVSGNREAQV
jgi:hypothetical protein